MIRYALHCLTCEHEFEAWFAGSDAFNSLKASGNLTCPGCDCSRVEKQIMAPSVRTKSAVKRDVSPDAALKELKNKAREHIATNFDYVGEQFADEARAMHYGEVEARPIWGQTTTEESKALKDEGVPAESLPEDMAPAKPRSGKLLN